MGKSSLKNKTPNQGGFEAKSFLQRAYSLHLSVNSGLFRILGGAGRSIRNEAIRFLRVSQDVYHVRLR